MSEFDRKKYSYHGKNKLYNSRDTGGSTPNAKGYKSSVRDRDGAKDSSSSEAQIKIKQPTILLKTREKEPVSEDVPASPKHTQKKENPAVPVTTTQKESLEAPTIKNMTKSAKLIDDGVIAPESLQEYMQENSDFLVIGVVGSQGVGKSTIMNILTHSNFSHDILKDIFMPSSMTDDNDEYSEVVQILTDQLNNVNIEEKEIFKTQIAECTESGLNMTDGIDMYVTSNRVILLDCQPFLSVAILDELIECENKRTNLVSGLIPLENSGEIQALQLTAFLMSVCHVLVVVQDWFFDSNVIRFVQTAEMLKPTISNAEDEYMEHFPHLVLVHNRAVIDDFSPSKFRQMQETYKLLFKNTKLQVQSDVGMGSGRIVNSINPENCGTPFNLFLIPEFNIEKGTIYCGHPPMEDIVKRFRANLFGVTKNPLAHVQLTEKTWLLYCAKVWDTVKKSSFFVEYTKLMP